MDSRGGYVSQILYVETKEQPTLGGGGGGRAQGTPLDPPIPYLGKLAKMNFGKSKNETPLYYTCIIGLVDSGIISIRIKVNCNQINKTLIYTLTHYFARFVNLFLFLKQRQHTCFT